MIATVGPSDLSHTFSAFSHSFSVAEHRSARAEVGAATVDARSMATAILEPATTTPTAPAGEGPLTHEARLGGIRAPAPTLQTVDRRRSQLWILAFAGLVVLAASIAVLASGTVDDLGVAGTLPFRIGTVVLVVALAVYVVEKEHHLRRLSQLLIAERISAETTHERLRELEALHAAGAAMNSVLVIEEVLRVILGSAIELLRPLAGAILLLEGTDSLVVVCSVGEQCQHPTRTRVGEGLAGRVARYQQPVLVSGAAPDGRPVPTETAICVPLVHRGELLGVLELSGTTGRGYTDIDVQSAVLLADHAAVAIANARLNDTERELHARLDSLVPASDSPRRP